MSTAIHLFDASRDENAVCPVTFYSEHVPRLGEAVRYSAGPGYSPEPPEPTKIYGIVERIEVEYRRGGSLTLGRPLTSVLVSVFLKEYRAE